MLKKNQILTGTVENNGFSGEGIIKPDGFTVFVPNTLKGEEIEYKILKVLKTHAFGKVIKVIKSSPHRREPLCPAFLRCGGCHLMHISYEEQLKIKKAQVEDCVKKYANLDIKVNDVLGMEHPYEYRNKAQYPISDGVCGFYALRSHNIVPINKCLMQNPLDEKIIKTVMKYVEKTNAKIKHIYTRYGDNSCMVVLVSKSAKLPFTQVLVKELLKVSDIIKSIILNVNPEDTNVILGKKNITLFGDDKITAKIGNLRFNISPLSFFQVNSKQTEVLYAKAKELLDLKGDETLLDLYCGTGSIGLFMADKAKKIVGVEIVEDAVKDAIINKDLNNVENAEYFAGAAEEILPKLVKSDLKPDAIILDPPRKGCDESLLRLLLEMETKKIVYISCSPATLARDLKILSKKYNISPITPVDMFPNTYHVETVVLLQRQNT